jgi:thiamine transporter
MLGGFIYSLLNLLLDAELWHWASFFLDYIIAFSVIGLGYAGVLLLGQNKKGFTLMVIIGVFLRFVSHWFAGWLLFADYMPESFDSPYIYSLVYNGYYLLPSMALIIIVGLVMFDRLKTTNIFKF